MADSSIEWTNKTWNPVSGCTRASAGCDNCYAVTMTHRLETMGQSKYTGLTVLNGKGDRHFNGKVRTHDDALTIPLKWKKPARVFVNSMSDLFHRDVPFEFIDKVFAVMALCPQHTFQVLTKRPGRMAEYFADLDRRRREYDANETEHEEFLIQRLFEKNEAGDEDDHDPIYHRSLEWLNKYNARNLGWPLPNVWLGTSVEHQKAADERIPHLLRCPAAVRFLSCEPLLGPVHIEPYFWLSGGSTAGPFVDAIGRVRVRGGIGGQMMTAIRSNDIHWVIVGGESGHHARPFDVLWAKDIVSQCKAAGVACFVKQLGSRPMLGDSSDPHGWPTEGGPVNWETGVITLKSNKGGDPSEWPEDLRVRQFPA